MVSKQAPSIYEFSPFRLDAARRLLLREGESVPLTPKCFELLVAFAESSGEVLSKEDLIQRVGPDSLVEEGNLTYNIFFDGGRWQTNISFSPAHQSNQSP